MELECYLKCLSLGGFGLQGIPGDFNQLGKGRGVGCGKVSQDLAIDGNLGRFESFHETAVSYPGCTRGGIDTDLPQCPESAFFGAAIAEGVLAAVIDGIRGIALEFGAAHPEAFGGTDHPGTALAGSWGVGNSHRSGKVKRA